MFFPFPSSPLLYFSLIVPIHALLIMSITCHFSPHPAALMLFLCLLWLFFFDQPIVRLISRIAGCHQPAALTVSHSSELWLMSVICARVLCFSYSAWWRVIQMLSPAPTLPLLPLTSTQPLNFSFALCVQPCGLCPLQSSHYLSFSVTSSDGLAITITSWHLDILLIFHCPLSPSLSFLWLMPQPSSSHSFSFSFLSILQSIPTPLHCVLFRLSISFFSPLLSTLCIVFYISSATQISDVNVNIIYGFDVYSVSVLYISLLSS